MQHEMKLHRYSPYHVEQIKNRKPKMKFQIAIKQMQLVTQLKMSISISISISIGKQIFTHRIEFVIEVYRTHRTDTER